MNGRSQNLSLSRLHDVERLTRDHQASIMNAAKEALLAYFEAGGAPGMEVTIQLSVVRGSIIGSAVSWPPVELVAYLKQD